MKNTFKNGKRIICLLSLFLFLFQFCVFASELKVQFLDVGQDLCVLAKADGYTLLYDGGGRDTSSFVVSYLKQQGIEKIDYLISSHYDEDHLAGLIGCLHVFDVSEVMGPDYEKDSDLYQSFLRAVDDIGLTIMHPVPGECYSFGESTFQVLAPDHIQSEENNNSLCIKIVNGDTSFLLTGDAEQEEEMEMVYSGLDLSSTVYCAGHHGSYSSTCESFLEKVNPDIAVISCGRDNSYGHPHQETMNLFESNNIEIYRTDIQGTIGAVSDGSSITWEQSPCNDYTSGDFIDNQDITKTIVSTDEVQNENTEDADYVLNKNSKKIHYPWCKSVNDMKEKNKDFYHGSISELLEKGYNPCHNCNPE